jgi:hypothetical protein
MKQTINKYQFREAFKAMGIESSFSYAGLDALFDFLEEVSPNLELDPMAIYYDFNEYESAVHCMDDCIINLMKAKEDEGDKLEEACLECLRENTCVIEFNGGIIIQNF